MILEKIKSQLKHAMKKSEKENVLAIRNILEKIKNVQVVNKEELSEEQIIKIIAKYTKQLKDSIQQFKDGGRDDLVEKESYELKIISQFLPEQLSKEEIDIIVQKKITDLKATSMSDMGMVIKKTMEITKGSADGKLISELARNYLR